MGMRRLLICSRCWDNLGTIPDGPAAARGILRGIVEFAALVLAILAHVQVCPRHARPADVVDLCLHGRRGADGCADCDGMRRPMLRASA